MFRFNVAIKKKETEAESVVQTINLTVNVQLNFIFTWAMSLSPGW